MIVMVTPQPLARGHWSPMLHLGGVLCDEAPMVNHYCGSHDDARCSRSTVLSTRSCTGGCHQALAQKPAAALPSARCSGANVTLDVRWDCARFDLHRWGIENARVQIASRLSFRDLPPRDKTPPRGNPESRTRHSSNVAFSIWAKSPFFARFGGSPSGVHLRAPVAKGFKYSI